MKQLPIFDSIAEGNKLIPEELGEAGIEVVEHDPFPYKFSGKLHGWEFDRTFSSDRKCGCWLASLKGHSWLSPLVYTAEECWAARFNKPIPADVAAKFVTDNNGDVSIPPMFNGTFAQIYTQAGLNAFAALIKAFAKE